MKRDADVARAIETIERDISGRAGLDNVWDSIDEDIKQEIRDVWGFAVTQAINASVGRLDFRAP